MDSSCTSRVSVQLIAIVFLLFSMACTADKNQWGIKERFLSPPASASKELRESIAATPAPDVAASQKAFSNADELDWNSLVAQRATRQNSSALQLAKSLEVHIERQTINGVNVHRVTPNSIDPKFNNSLFLYIHGGAYVFGGGDASVAEAAVIAHTSKIPVLSIDYRMPPASPFPAAVDDVVIIYKHILETISPKSIAIGGTSAGGGLALAAVHQFITLGLETPGAIYGGTPWADLTKTGDSLFTNEGIDRVLITYDGAIGAAARLYANGQDLKNPLISPLYGDFSHFPPTYLVTGTRDMFLSDTSRVHRKLRTAGVIAELNVYEGMSHAGYAINLKSPESKQVYTEMKNFLLVHLE